MLNAKNYSIIIRYIIITLLSFILSSNFFIYSLQKLYTRIIAFILNLNYSDISIFLENKVTISIVEECIAPSLFILISVLIFSFPLKPKELFSNYIQLFSIVLFFNFLRIIIIIKISSINFALATKVHFLMFEILNALVIGIILFLYLRKKEFKNKLPIITDIKNILKHSSK